MVNNDENERESSPPQVVKKRATRRSTIQDAPAVADTSFMTSASAPGGDLDAVAQGQGSMKYQKAQTGRFEDADVGAAPASTTAQAGLPQGYQFGRSINPSPASGAARKKSAATKSSGNKSSGTGTNSADIKSTGTTNLSDTTSAATESTSLKPLVRISQSCTPCRRRKARCVKVEGQDRCEYCEKMDKNCFYEPTTKKITRLPAAEDEPRTPATKKVQFSDNTKKASKTSKVSKASSKMDQTRNDTANDTDMSNTAATAYSVGDEGSPEVDMTDKTAPAPAAAKRSSGLGFFDNSGGFARYEKAADEDTTSFFKVNPIGTDEPNLGSHATPSNTAGDAFDPYAFDPTATLDNPYGLDEAAWDNYGPDLNTAGALLDQFEFERNAWPDEYPVRDPQDEPHYDMFDDFLTPHQSAPAQPEADQPEVIELETGRETPKINIVYRGPIQAPAGTTLSDQTPALYSRQDEPQSQHAALEPNKAPSSGMQQTQSAQNAYAPANNESLRAPGDSQYPQQTQLAFRDASTTTATDMLALHVPEAVQPSAVAAAASQFNTQGGPTARPQHPQQSFQAALGLPNPADDDYTDTVASYLQNPVLTPGNPEYAYTCAKVLYMAEKARADNLRASSAAELEQLEAYVETLRKEAVEKWEVANAGRQEEAFYDKEGLQFLKAFAPK